MFVIKISKKNDFIIIETDSLNIQFPLLENDNLQNILDELYEEKFFFSNLQFVKYCLNIFIKKTRILSISN